MSEKLKILVGKANSGDKKALESVVLQIKDMVYNLSLKMLLFPDDAKDQVLFSFETSCQLFEQFKVIIKIIFSRSEKNIVSVIRIKHGMID